MPAYHRGNVDQAALRRWRLDRVRAQLRARDYAGILLYDPLNIRYASDSCNMQVWTTHNAARYCFIATDGPLVVFDFHGCAHLSAEIETVDQVRAAISWFYFLGGPESESRAEDWAGEIADLVHQYGRENKRLAIDKCDPLGTFALSRRGIELKDGQEVMELARAIKAPVEIEAMRTAIAAAEEGMRRMQQALEPGITENRLWSLLHQANIELGGEWIETRLLASGPRTNPWFQECSDRVIDAGDLVSFDTDLIGPYGYCADISRSWRAGDGKPDDAQRALYEIAMAQIRYNADLLKPGMSFREFSENSFQLPDDCIANRYSVVAHGVGLCDEYPSIVYTQDWGSGGYDGIIEPGMTLCIESLVGQENGRECVKLEEQVLITDTGVEFLSSYPFESHWLS